MFFKWDSGRALARIFTIITLCGTSSAAPINDNFDKGLVISGYTNALFGTLEGSSFEPGEPYSSGSGAGSLWWHWRAPADGMARFAALTNQNGVAVYTGTGLGHLQVVLDASYSHYGRVEWPAVAGVTYHIRLYNADDYYQGPIAASFVLHPAVPNNDRFRATAITGTDVLLHADASGAENSILAGLWWQWTAPADGEVIFDVSQSSPTAMFTVHPVRSDTVLINLKPGPAQQTFSMWTTTGQSYWVHIWKDFPSQFDVALSVRMSHPVFRPGNDDFADRYLLEGWSVATNYTKAAATIEEGEPPHLFNNGSYRYDRSVWFTWTAPQDGAVSCTVLRSELVELFHGTQLENLVPLARETHIENRQSAFVSAGETLQIAVAGGYTNEFPLFLHFVAKTTNDDFANATVLEGDSLDFKCQPAGASAEAGEPANALGETALSSWFSWTPVESGAVTLRATFATFPPLLDVYTGSAVDALSQVTGTSWSWRTSAYSRETTVSFDAAAGQTYRIRATAWVSPGDTDDEVQVQLRRGLPPEISLSFDPTNSVVAYGTPIHLTVDAQDAEGPVREISIAWDTNAVDALPASHFETTMTNLLPGLAVVRARAVDVDGLAAEGTAIITIRSPNDDLTNRFVLPTVSDRLFMDFRGSTAGPGEPFAGSWWSWTAPADGTYYIANSSAPTIAIHEVGEQGIGEPVASGFQSYILRAHQGAEYAILIGISPYINTGTTTISIFPSVLDAVFTNRTTLIRDSDAIGVSPTVILEAGDPAVPVTLPIGSSWWSWEAPGDGFLKLSAVGGTAAAYTGDTVDTLEIIPPVGAGIVPVLGGTKYALSFAFPYSLLASNGLFQYEFYPATSNDDFANRVLITGRTNEFGVINYGASSEPGEAAGAHSLWWSWTAPSTGFALVEAGGNYLPNFLVATGDAISKLVSVGRGWSAGSTAMLLFSAVEGTTYQFAVSGVEQLTHFKISIPTPPNDFFANRIFLAGFPAAFSGITLNAGPEPGDPVAGRTLWWSWTAPEDTTVTITPDRADQTMLAFVGDSLGGLSAVPRIGAGSYSFAAQAGVTYQILMVGANDATANPAFEDVLQSNQAPRVDIEIDSNQRVFLPGEPVALTVHAQDPDGVLTNVTFGWRQFTPFTPEAAYPVTFTDLGPGTYDLMAEASDNLGLTIMSTPLTIRVAPENDTWAEASPLNGARAEATGANIGAIREPGEPSLNDRAGDNSIWWTWTAPHTGRWTLSTSESSFDTVLAVYTGPTLSSLVLVAVNDDQSREDPRSELSFNAVSGEAYYFAVAGAEGAAGEVRLHLIEAPVNDGFEAPSVIEPHQLAHADLRGASVQTGEPVHGSAPGGHSLWWTWTAPADGSYVLSSGLSDFDTVLAVYTGSTLTDLTRIAADDDSGPHHTSLVRFDAVGGENYRIAVDQYAPPGGEARLLLARGDERLFAFAPAEDGQMRLNLLSASDTSLRLESSTNLVDWTLLGNATNGMGVIEMMADPGSAPVQFFRAVP